MHVLPLFAAALLASNPTVHDEPSAKPETKEESADHLRVGVLGTVAFPRPLAIEGFIKIERLVGIGLEYGVLPTTNIAGATVRYAAVAGDLRIFPFRNSFFVGMRAGRQWLDATSSLTVAGYGTITESVGAQTWFVNPRLGVLWTSPQALTVGISAGVQIPLAHTTSSTLPAQYAAYTQGRERNTVDAFTSSVLPTVDLLQLGLLF